MWQPWPTALVNTPVGELVVAVTDAQHIHACTPKGGTFTIRGVAYRGGVHVYRDGRRWQHRTRSDVSIRRADSPREASDGARRTFIAAVEGAVNEWAAQHPEVIREAAQVEVGNREAAVRGEIAELEGQIARKRDALLAIIRERRAMDVRSAVGSDL